VNGEQLRRITACERALDGIPRKIIVITLIEARHP